MALNPAQVAQVGKVLDAFSVAVREKLNGNSTAAKAFVEEFETLAADLPVETRDNLRRGMFQILKR